MNIVCIKKNVFFSFVILFMLNNNLANISVPLLSFLRNQAILEFVFFAIQDDERYKNSYDKTNIKTFNLCHTYIFKLKTI